MIRIRLSLAFACAIATTISLVSPVAARDAGILSIVTGHSLVLRGRGIARVAVGDGKVAGAIALDPTKIVINAKSAGETTLFVWDADGQHDYELTVIEHRLEQIVRMLRSQIDSPSVTLDVVGSTVVLGGKVADLAEFGRVSSIVDHFKDIKFDTATPVNIANTITMRQPLGRLQDEIDRIPSARDLRVDSDPATGNLVISGRVGDRQQAQDIVDRVNGLAGPYLRSDGKVVDRLALDTKSLVSIKVDVLEVDKTAQSDLGLRLGSATTTSVGSGTNTFTIGNTPQITAVESTRVTAGANPFLFGPFSRVSLLAPTLNLLVNQGHARVLSSPTLVAMPGKSASYLVGGQIPIPISNGLGSISIEYKQFGVSLVATPTIQADGGIDTVLAPEISDLDFADGVQVNGFLVPALKTSKISTEVLTEDGESIILGGLLRRVEQRNVQKFPILGDLPILGPLFRSTSYQKTDTDVVFVLTPKIITKRRALVPSP